MEITNYGDSFPKDCTITLHVLIILTAADILATFKNQLRAHLFDIY